MNYNIISAKPGEKLDVLALLKYPEDFHGSTKVDHLVKFGSTFVGLIGPTNVGLPKEGVVVLEHYYDQAKKLMDKINTLAQQVISDAKKYDDVGFCREYFELASEDQLKFFPAKYVRGLIDQIDHSIGIISETDKHELEGIDPKKIMLRNIAFKPAKEWRDAKENAGKFTWTLALYGTPAMATEAKMSLEKYWDQIIKACFLDKNPQRPSVRVYFRDVKNLHSESFDEEIKRRHADVTNMFVVDHIEKHFLEHGREVSEFNNKKTVFSKKFPDIPTNGLDIIDMGKHIVGADNVGFSVFRDDFADRGFAKIAVQGHHALSVRLSRKIFREPAPDNSISH